MEFIKKLFRKTPKPRTYTTLEACQEVIQLAGIELDRYRGGLPSNLKQVSDAVFPALPEAIRDDNTPMNRAEMSAAIHHLAIGLHWMRKWMED